ncbi:putative protein tyrosine phosphatase [Parvibaculum sp. MBR-TMA-1.3b-4.2]
MMIYVSPLSAVHDAIRKHAPSHLVSLLDPDTMIETPEGFDPARHLRIGVNDIAEPIDDLAPPTQGHVVELIEFIRAWDLAQRDGGPSPLLVHCWAGISRSTAAAFIALCILNEDQSEAFLARQIRDSAPHAHPNRLMVTLADDALGRGGRMVAAVDALGPGRAAWEGMLFGLPVRLEEG